MMTLNRGSDTDSHTSVNENDLRMKMFVLFSPICVKLFILLQLPFFYFYFICNVLYCK